MFSSSLNTAYIIFSQNLSFVHNLILSFHKYLPIFSCFRSSDSLPFSTASILTASALAKFKEKHSILFYSFCLEEKLSFLFSYPFDFANFLKLSLLSFYISFRYIFKFVFNLFDLLLFSLFLLFFCFTPSKRASSFLDLYICLYWKAKGSNSAQYYFNDFPHSHDSKVFYSDYYGFKSVSYGLLVSRCSSNSISLLNICTFSSIIKSFIYLLHTLVSDFMCALIHPILFPKFLYDYSSINRRYLYILNSVCLNSLLLNTQSASVTCWHESQANTSSITAFLRHNQVLFPTQSFTFHSFMGFPVSSYGGLPNYKPSVFDNIMLTCFKSIILQDAFSLEDLSSSPSTSPFTYNVCRNSLRRYSPTSNFSRLRSVSPSRKFTLFSHSLEYDLDLLFKFVQAEFSSNNLLNSPITIYLRIHPALSRDFVVLCINYYFSDYPTVKFIFIDNSIESIYESIAFSELNIFSESAYSNFSILLERKTLVFQTSFRNLPPIQSIFLDSKFLSLH